MYRPGPSSNGSNGGASAGPILDVSHHLRDGRNWLVLVGELDFGSAPQLVAALNAAQRDGRPIVVDLRGLRFIDSSGLRARRPQLTRRSATIPTPPGHRRTALLRAPCHRWGP